MVGSAAYIGGSTVIGQSGPYSGATTQDLTVTGRIGTNGRSPSSGYPSGWWGGVHTWDLYAEGSIGVGQSGSLNAGVRSNGRIWTNEYIQISSVSTAGYGCSPNGLIGRDEYGYMLSCVNGVWTRAGGKMMSALVAVPSPDLRRANITRFLFMALCLIQQMIMLRYNP